MTAHSNQSLCTYISLIKTGKLLNNVNFRLTIKKTLTKGQRIDQLVRWPKPALKQASADR
jgi:hypothetical protein